MYVQPAPAFPEHRDLIFSLSKFFVSNSLLTKSLRAKWQKWQHVTKDLYCVRYSQDLTGEQPYEETETLKSLPASILGLKAILELRQSRFIPVQD